MDYPKSVASVGLVNGKFVDENPVTGQVGSLISSEWGNAVTDEILNVISSADMSPNEESNSQLLEAIQTIIAKKIPLSPGQATETSAGIAKVATSQQLSAGVDDSAFLTSKKLVPHINAAIKSSLVQATESVVGIARVATQPMVSEGVDDRTFVTPLKLSSTIRRVATLEGSQVFTKVFNSGEQVITTGGYLTLAHGLGVGPTLWKCYLVCKEPEHGYWAGAVISTGSAAQDNAYNLGVSVVPDATNLNCRFGTQTGVFFVLDWNAGVTKIITPGKWRLMVRAWA